MYTNLFEQKYDFTYSANVQYDIKSDSKLRNFIPNSVNVKLLKRLFYNVTNPNSERNCSLVYGSYGTGKSHLMTVLGQLLQQSYPNSEVLSIFFENVSKVDNSFNDMVKKFYSNDKPYLLVPVSSNFDDFNRCIYKSLKKTLKEFGYDVNFQDFYSQALDTVYRWEDNELSKSRLEKVCKEYGTNIHKLKSGLKSYNEIFKDTFKKIFEGMTFGVSFLYEASNLEETIKDVNATISERYAGIVFVFDEFGKYLEDNLKKVKVKQVQDLAEFCDRSSNRLILVSHKQIALYTNKSSKKYIEEWKKVEGRFDKISINDDYDQSLMLVQSLISKTQEFNTFEVKFKRQLEELYQQGLEFKGFSLKGYDIPRNVYPLHTATLYALDRLSKKVAQNDRTFFTYICNQGKDTLQTFLNSSSTDEFHFVGLDNIFDYFEPNFREYQGEDIYNVYRSYLTAISKCSDSVEVKILKAVAIVYTVNDGSALPCNKYSILNYIDYSKSELEEALERLCSNKVLKLSRLSGLYEFFNGSVVDVDALILEKVSNISESACINILNEDFKNFLVYPYEHNEKYKIKRAFIPYFMSYHDFVRKSHVSKAFQSYDGMLIMVLANDDYSMVELKEVSKKLPHGICMVNLDCNTILEEVKKYIAILSIETNVDTLKEEDLSVVEEIRYYKDEQIDIINGLVKTWWNVDHNVFVVSNGEEKIVTNVSDLSRLASYIMDERFNQSMVVNNELLNKNKLQPSMVTAKKSAINSILSHFNEDNFGITNVSPEYLIVRSVLIKNGFTHFTNDDTISMNSIDGELSSKYVLKIIDDFLNKCKEAPTSMNELYDALTQPPIGCRLGYIDVILAYILAENANDLTIDSHGTEKELSYSLVQEICKRPQDYSVYINLWDTEQTIYIEELEELFKEYYPNRISQNRLKNLYDAIMLHYKNMSKFSRTTELHISDVTKEYRTIMNKTYSNYNGFFFETLYHWHNFEAVRMSKQELENVDSIILSQAKSKVVEIFNLSTGNIVSQLMQCYTSQWSSKKSKIFDYYTNQFLNIVSHLTSQLDESILIGKLSKVMVGFELSYWNDTHLDDFTKRLENVKNALDNYIPMESSQEETKVTISTGEKSKEIVLSNAELSDISITLKNRIVKSMNDFGVSLSDEEKVQTLISVIGELIKE